MTAAGFAKEKMEDLYTLSPMQQGMLFHDLYANGSGMYTERLRYTIHGELNVPMFQRAWRQVVARHAVLRTAFVWKEVAEPHQAVFGSVELPWEVEDWRRLPAAEQQTRLQSRVEAIGRRGFDLSRAPLVRMTLIRTADRVHEFIWSYHHLILDGWSVALLLREPIALYAALCRNASSHDLPPAGRPYRDYIAWLRQQDQAAAETFWRAALDGFSKPISFGAAAGEAEPAKAYDEQRMYLSREATARMESFARAHRLTRNTLVQGAWALLLAAHSGESDVVFGGVVSGRPADLADSERMVGMFVNTLPVRARVSPEAALLPWLHALQAQQIESRRYEYVPLVKVQAWSEAPRGTPMFESLVVFENQPLEVGALDTGPLEIRDSFHYATLTGYPLTLVAEPGPELALILAHECRRFDAAAAGRMLAQLRGLLESMIADPAQPLAALLESLRRLSPEERRRVLVEFNRTEAAEGALEDRTFAELFETRVQETPDRPAVVCARASLTYAELNARADRLAAQLRAEGVGPESLVALIAGRDSDFLTAMLAVFKAGGAYLPLDPHHPPARLGALLQRAGASLVLTTDELGARLAENWGGVPARPRIVSLPALLERGASASAAGPVISTARSLSYVIYTSGSTGAPKGAMIEQGGMLNHLHAKIQDLNLTAADVVAQTASQGFDISVWQFLAVLLRGGCVRVIGDETARDPARLLDAIVAGGVTILEIVPSLLRALLDELAGRGASRPALAGLRWLLVTGEALPPELCRRWLALYPAIPLMNAYGPTECSDDVTHAVIREAPAAGVARVPIGRPVSNLRLYVLDRDLAPLPAGVAGELFVGGAGVGRGYLNEAGATAAAFLPDPFSAQPQDVGARLYRTGDMARHLPDGALDFLGRMDTQVKVRGFRIELGEIEAALAQHPAVREVVVLMGMGQMGQMGQMGFMGEMNLISPISRLIAYFTETEPTATIALRQYLADRLPDYMIPAVFVRLERMPLTANGKIDRRALPEPDPARPELETGFVAPRTPDEARLCELWKQVLGVEAVGIHDNFFDLGGDSILSLQVVARAHQAGLRLTPRQIFQFPTVAELAAAETAGVVEAEQGLVTGPVPLTPIQGWFREQALAAPHHWNQSVLLEVPAAAMDAGLLETALNHLLLHHDALRLRWEQAESGWRQTIAGAGQPVPFSYVDLSALEPGARPAAIEARAARVQAGLNLSEGPLLGAACFHLGAGRPGRLLIVIHHLAVDGVSWRILLEDFQLACRQLRRNEAVRLPRKTTSFQQWASRLAGYAAERPLDGELDYWLRMPREQLAPLPVDHCTGANDEGSARRVRVSLEADETRALLQEVPAAWRTDVNEVLLAALAASLARWTGRGGVLFDLEGHGREPLPHGEEMDLSRTVGWFTALFPVWFELPAPNGDPGRTLAAVKEQLRRVPNKGLPARLARYLGGPTRAAEELRGLPQAELSFNYLGQLDRVLPESAPESEPEASWFRLAPEPRGPERDPRGNRRYLIEILGHVAQGRLHLEWVYSANRHRAETIKARAADFLHTLQSFIRHCRSAKETDFRPSDFAEFNWNQDDLDGILAEIAGVSRA
jgi:amino acid adenylation domain-containing protein/non-ribosomal peptide synthase protein (TIGR01720 family)